MGRESRRLTDLRLRRIQPASRDQWLADGSNLYLRVSPNGARTWTVRRRLSRSKVQILRLGAYPQMSLSEARKALDGTDFKSGALNETVGGLLDDWYERQIRSKYRRPRQVWLYVERLKADYPELAKMKLRDVRLAHVSAALVHYAGDAPVGANRLATIVKQAFRYGVQRGWLTASPVVEMARATIGGDEATRDRVLTDVEIRALWAINHRHGDLMRFLLVTGQRIGEAQKAKWANVDLEVHRWRIPQEDAKNAKEHWAPLSSLAIEILERQRRDRGRVFGAASNTAVQAWLRRLQKSEGAYTPHDLRRTFSTRLNALGVAPHVVEKMLNHSLQGTMSVYNRAAYEAERIAAAAVWDVEIRKILS